MQKLEVPSDLTLHSVVGSQDGTRAVRTWEADTVDSIRNFVDPASEGMAMNEYFEAKEQYSMGPPGSSCLAELGSSDDGRCSTVVVVVSRWRHARLASVPEPLRRIHRSPHDIWWLVLATLVVMLFPAVGDVALARTTPTI